MNIQAIFHQAKSHMSYAYDKETLHILLQTSASDEFEVSLIYGDPFHWGKIDETFTWIHKKELMVKRYKTSLFNYYFIAIKPDFKRVKYGFILTHDNHRYFYGTHGLILKDHGSLFETYDLSSYFNFPFLNHEDVMNTPLWAKHMVWYQIFPDRFYTDEKLVDWTSEPVLNHTRFGGTLLGIAKKIPYLSSLGIQGIYFTPIFEASSMHKYDTVNYFKIDPHFGTNEDFKYFVDQAHQHGIKVMLDGVFNHTGFFHPFFQDVIKNHEHSIYKDAFFIKQFPVIDFELDERGYPKKYQNTPKRFDTFSFTPMMPKWNTSNHIAKEHLLDVVSYWIKHFNIDGWRIDVSNEISHDFLRKIRERARMIRDDVFILGENWDSSLPWLLGDQLDAVMNYDLSVPIWRFLDHKINHKTFIEQLHLYLSRTPKHVIESMFNLVCTHDTIRIKRRLGDSMDKVKLAYALMFMQAGSPSIYYGDEIGLTGEHDPDNRRPMIWDEALQDLDMLSFMKQLILIKKTYKPFSVADFNALEDDHLLIIKKHLHHEHMIAVFNYSSERVQLPNELIAYQPLLKTCQDILEPYQFYIGVRHETNHS
jgi:glycosidase